MNLPELQEKLGHSFADLALLERALTHRSWSEEAIAQQSTHEFHNERLEFLGDMVLGLSVTQLLCWRFPAAPEGELSRVRSTLVRTEALERMARQMGLGAHLRLGRGEELSLGREKGKILANSLEAVLGAIFEDGGFPSARGVVERVWAPLFAEIQQIQGFGLDPKSRLQHHCQTRWGTTPRYRIVAEEGPAHERRFQATVVAGDQLEVQGGFAARKQDAERLAAVAAMELLESGEE